MVTTKRDLRTGRPVWPNAARLVPPIQALDGPVETDVLLIGAGISGAMIAEALADAGLSVAIVDRRGAVKGSTAASTALLQYEIDTPLTELSRMIGTKDAARAWRRSRLALDALGARVRDRSIAPIVRRDTLYLAGDMLDADGLRRECEARTGIGLETRFLDTHQLAERFGMAREAALIGYDNLAADPVQLAAGFLREAIAKGAVLLGPAEIVEIDAKKTIVVARTDGGHAIHCRHLVLATGYEFPDMVPQKGHRIISTWAIATRAQKARLWPEQCLVWEASDPYLYLRTTADGRVICGGEDEDFADDEHRDALLPAKAKTLSAKLSVLQPQLDVEPDFAWTGSFGTTRTGLPLIGAVPGQRNCWAAMGYGGNGITYSRIAAEIIRSGILGRTDPDADLYAFTA